MKMLSFATAALVAAVAIPAIAAPADAQTRVVVHTDNGYYHGHHHWRHRVVYRNDCHTVWRHHERQRVCERVRVTRG